MAATVIDALFGDVPVESWPPDDDASAFPWSAFVDARRDPDRAVELWRQIAAADVEPRHVAQAWHVLRGRGVQPPADEAARVLGFVIEMGMKRAPDVLAVYADRSVRHYNHAGGGVVIERARGRTSRAVGQAAAGAAGQEIGPCQFPHPRRPALRAGPTKQLYDDLAGPVLQGATLLLTLITART
jgi:hypothetical protein